MKRSTVMTRSQYRKLVDLKIEVEWQRLEMSRAKASVEHWEDEIENYNVLLKSSVGEILWRMCEICFEKKIMKTFSKSIFDLFDFDLSLYLTKSGNVECTNKSSIKISNLTSLFAKLIVDKFRFDGIPVSWLWDVNWEDEFIREWLGK